MFKRLVRLIARPGAPRAEDSASADSLLLHIGTTSGQRYGLWDGRIYPAGLIGTDLRGYSALGFDAIEIRASFYHLPKPDTLAHWAEQAPASFRFVLCAPSRITHLQRLERVEMPLRHLLRAANALGERCGPLLFQLPKGFARNDACLLRFLDLLPARTPAAFEFLDPSWQHEAVYDHLRERNCAVSVRDSEQGGAGALTATADWGYLRLGRMHYTDEDLRRWLEQMQRTPWRSAYVFFRHEDDQRAQDHLQRLETLAKSATA
jgi:uncharacterized protein YecE (DUF72 family)